MPPPCGPWGSRQGSLLLLILAGHRGKAWSDDTSQLGPDKHARDVPSLDKYAEERWEVRTGPLCASALPHSWNPEIQSDPFVSALPPSLEP